MSEYCNAAALVEAVRIAQQELRPVSPEQRTAAALDEIADDLAEVRPALARKVRKWKRSVQRENPAARETRRRVKRGHIKVRTD